MTDIHYIPTADGDIDAYYTNGYGARLHGYIGMEHGHVAIGVTGISGVERPFGIEAVDTSAINRPAYRAKIIESAKVELERQFLATDPAA